MTRDVRKSKRKPFLQRQYNVRQTAIRCVLGSVIFLIFSVIADRIIGVVAPARQPVQVAHPINFQERRNNLEFNVEFRTNSQGLRSPEIPLKKTTPNEFRIVFSGDSFTEGHGVKLEEAYPLQVAQLGSTELQIIRSINCGFSGSGPLQYCRGLFCVGLKYNPDLVVIGVYSNDLLDTSPDDALLVQRTPSGGYQVPNADLKWQPGTPLRRLAYQLLPWTYSRLQLLRSTQSQESLRNLPFIDQLHERGRQAGFSKSELSEWEQRLPPHILKACNRGLIYPARIASGFLQPDHYEQMLEIRNKETQFNWQAMQNIFKRTVELCQHEKIPVAFLYIPTYVQYDQTICDLDREIGAIIKSEWLTGQAELELRLQNWCQRSSLDYFSLTTLLRKACLSKPGGYNLKIDGHWNRDGHTLVATAVLNWLTSQKLVPRPSDRVPTGLLEQ